jgi:ABC-type multidrug transport system fused ATPase/permease subunit
MSGPERGGGDRTSRRAGLWLELLRLSWARERKLTAVSLAFVVGSVAVVGVSALSLRATVDATSGHRQHDAVVAAVVAAVAYALGIVVQQSLQSLVNVTLDRVGRLALHAEIHRDIASIEGIAHLEQTEFLDRLTIVRSASGKVMAWFWYSVLAAAGMLELGVMLLLLGTISPWLLVLLVFAAVPVWFNHVGQGIVARAEVDVAEAVRLQQQLFTIAVQAAGAKELMLSGAGPDIMRRQGEAWHDAERRRHRAQMSAAALQFAGWAVFAVCFVASVGLVAYRTTHGDGTLGDLVLTVMGAVSLRQILQNAVSSALRTAGANRYIEPLLWLRGYAAAERARTDGTATPPQRLRGGITLDGVDFRYPGTTTAALDRVSIHLPAGSVVAVVGEYGSGKTTLVKLLLKLYRPDGGRIRVDDIDFQELNTAGWRRRSSAVFQDFARFHTTVGETVGLGDLDAVDDPARLDEALRAADAEDLVRRLPDGLQTQLGRALGGVELSEGQWQRTALARASMRLDPLLFVLDEPTASLDAPSEQAVFDRYMARARKLAADTGAVTVVVSHRFSTVADADLIVVMRDGRIVESGSHRQLLESGGLYAEMYGIQVRAYAME